MKLIDWLPSSKDLEALQGLERELLARRRNGQRVSWLFAAGGLLPVLLGPDYSRLDKFVESLTKGYWPWLALALLTAAGLAYVGTRYTALLLRHTDEVFRYSFSVQPFKWIAGTPGDRATLEGQDRIELLSLDLTGMLAKRIARMDLLQAAPTAPNGATTAAPTRSHITISGDIALREQPDDGWVLHATPRLRAGDANAPEVLSYAVKFRLGSASPSDKRVAFTPAQYQQFCERVYASAALAVYQCIRKDLQAKLALFPTRYRRVQALLNEAEDLAQSNTVDATHSAVGLYKRALQDFDACWKWGLARLMRSARLPAAWYRDAYLTRARLLTGKTNCEVTNAIAATLVGKVPKGTYGLRRPLVAAVNELNQLAKRLNGEPAPHTRHWTIAERTRQRQQRSKDKLMSMLFDARVALALAHLRESETEHAQQQLQEAEKLSPGRTGTSRELLLLKADMTPEVPEKVTALRTLMERYPDFQIGQIMLASWSEMQLRSRGELDSLRAAPIVRAYERVLEINAGNVGALSSLGYLHWLLGQHAQARARYEEGLNLIDAAHQSDIYVGELHYGLARVAGEQACLTAFASQTNLLMMEALDHYAIAVDRDPGLAVGSGKTDRTGGTGPFEYIVPAMRLRFMGYRLRVQRHLRRLQREEMSSAAPAPAERTRNLNRLLAFVANDVANAQLQSRIRLNTQHSLTISLALVERACRLAPDTAAFHVNHYVHGTWNGLQLRDALKIAKQLAGGWTLIDDYLVQTLGAKLRESAEADGKPEGVSLAPGATIAARKTNAAAAPDTSGSVSPTETRMPSPGVNTASRAAIELPAASSAAPLNDGANSTQQASANLEKDIEDIKQSVAAIYKRLPMRALQNVSVLTGRADDPPTLSNVLDVIDVDELDSDHFRGLIRAQRTLLALHGALSADKLGNMKTQLHAEIKSIVRWLGKELSGEEFDLLELRKDIGGDCFDDAAKRAWERLYLQALRADPAHWNTLEWIKNEFSASRFKAALVSLAEGTHYVPHHVRCYARRELDRFLPQSKPARPYADAGDVSWPLPLALDMSKDLVADVVDEQSQLRPATERALRSLRQHVRQRRGVELPGLRLRPNDALEPGTSVLSVFDVPTLLINAKEAAPAVALTLPELPKAIDSVLRHVYAALPKLLSCWCGPQEVQELWDQQSFSAASLTGSVNVRTGLPPMQLLRLTSLMRVLLDQGLPVHDLTLLAEQVGKDLACARPDFDALVLRARASPSIRQHLHEDTRDAPVWQLSVNAQRQLVEHLHGDGDLRSLALPPEFTQEMLFAVRDAWADTQVQVLLITEGHLINSLTAVLRMEWPQCVVAMPQELPQRLFATRGLIDWDA